MTAIGHFAVASETEWNPSIITFAMKLRGGEAPLTSREFQALWQAKDMPRRHERFHQRLAPNRNGGGWHFIPPSPENHDDVSIERNLTETVYPRDRFDLRSRLQHMQMDRWDYQDSLWYMTIAGQKLPQDAMKHSLEQPSSSASSDSNESHTLLLFRGHHALADGASMAAALADLFDEAEQLREATARAISAWKRRRKGHGRNMMRQWWMRFLKLLHLLLGTLQSLRYQTMLFWHGFWDEDPWKQLQQLASSKSSKDVPLYRTLAWSEVAPVDQVKWVADVLGRAHEADGKAKPLSITVNDVFVSCVTAALARQLQEHRQRLLEFATPAQDESSRSKTVPRKPLAQQRHIHVAVPVHLKGGVILPGESVGNNIGAFVARVPGESETQDSVERLVAVSSELGFVKRTPTAALSHFLAKSLSYASAILPVSWISKLYASSNAGSLVVVSNKRGAPLPVHLAGRRVESIYGFVPLPPGIPIGVTITSYAGHMSCTVAAEPWAVPDGDQFMVWILEEYLRLVAAAKMKASAD
jgi:WS/DGAT C-terminal domain